MVKQRTVFQAILVGALLTVPHVAYADTSRPAAAAPADEYFGTQHESVLGIRNRIQALEAHSDDFFEGHPDASIAMDSLAEEILDWHKQYPSDSWIPKVTSRLYVLYVRAHAEHSAPAMTLLALLTTSYPDSDATGDAIAFMERTPEAAAPAPVPSSAPSVETANVRHGVVTDVNGAPVIGADVEVSMNGETLSFLTNEHGEYLLPSALDADHPAAVTVRPPAGSHLNAYSGVIDPRQANFQVIQLQAVQLPSYAQPDP